MQKKIGTTIQNESVVNQIVRQITDAIIDGTLKPGDRLPTEPELRETFGAGRNSIREAIKILEAYGVVYIRRPDGTYVNDSYNQKMLDPMLYGILLQKDFTKDIVQLRKVLDIGIIQTLPIPLPEADLANILKAFESLKAAALSPAADSNLLMQADMNFHMSLIGAAHNKLLANMYSYVDRMTIPTRLNAVSSIIAGGETVNFIQLHQNLIDILEGKRSDIEHTISDHYVYWKKTL